MDFLKWLWNKYLTDPLYWAIFTVIALVFSFIEPDIITHKILIIVGAILMLTTDYKNE